MNNLCRYGLAKDTERPRPKPNEEQKKILWQVIERCLKEAQEELNDFEFRSEPKRFILRGIPGAGKSKLLFWLRDFYEEVSAWTHGVQFVFVASQNSMAALIAGSTLHSYGMVPFNTKKWQAGKHI